MLKLKNGNYKLVSIIAIFLVSVFAWLIISGSRFLTIPVLAFHNVLSAPVAQSTIKKASSLDYYLKDLHSLLIYLLDNNYWFLDSQEMYDYFVQKSKPIPQQYRQRKPILLTFDDGHKNIDTYLLPLLNTLEIQYEQKIKVVLWVNPKNIIDRKANRLTCSDLQKGVQQGFYDVQSHGFSHVDLTKLTISELDAELEKSQDFLQQCLSEKTANKIVARHFAYPFNQFNNLVKKHTAKYYLSAYRFNSRYRNIRFKKDNYTIPRIGINQKDTVEDLIKLIK